MFHSGANALTSLPKVAVKAILLTHGDSDHSRGVLHFPKAEVMAREADVALAER